MLRRRVSSFIAHKDPGVKSLVRSKRRLTPAGMLTQNLYHQYLIAGLLPPDKWAHVGIFPRLTKVMLNAGVSVCVWQICEDLCIYPLMVDVVNA